MILNILVALLVNHVLIVLGEIPLWSVDLFSQHVEVSIHLLPGVSRSRQKIPGNNVTAIFDSKMAADLAVADNSGVTTDGEIIVVPFKIYNFPIRLRKIHRKKRLKAGLLQLWAMVVVKIIFMLVGFAGDISFLRAGSLSRNNHKGKKNLRLWFPAIVLTTWTWKFARDLLLNHVIKSVDLKGFAKAVNNVLAKRPRLYLLQEVKFLLTNIKRLWNVGWITKCVKY